MPVQPGTRLGPYEVLAPVGAGGMGEVYKARDTRLDRTVAIKVLPSHVASNPELKQRFEREAKTLAALSHPHICPVFDVGQQDGIDYLVMEYLEGQTLAQRVEKGALSLDQALQYATQIADALDKAHRQGIVHRDLKPGNIMLTTQGAKLLDFGLAKLKPPSAVASLSMLPTQDSPMTAPGTILGTFQYMAPEQLEGQEADARTDLFAFGCVLYEMLTGRKAFEGKTHASLIAAILQVEPPLVSTIQPIAPRALDRVVKKCLAKQADDRWQSARDLRDELKWVAEPGAMAGDASAAIPAKPAVPPVAWRRSLPWAVAAGALIVAIGVLVLWAPWRNVASPAPLRLNAELGADLVSVPGPGAATILSPDGAVVAFVAQKGGSGSAQLYVRRLNQLQAVLLSGTDGATNPFFSPDGQRIAFFASGTLKTISVTGGAAAALCDAPNARGGAWGEDGTIVFSPDNTPGTSLLRVSSAGGKPASLTSLAEGEVTQRWPQVLPGGKAVLFTSSSNTTAFNDANLVVQLLPSGARKIVQRGGYYGRYLPSGLGSPTREGGHLVYMHDGTLFAAPFDLDRLEVTGQPVPALEGVASNPASGAAQFAESASGTLVYSPGQSNTGIPIHWMDHEGKTTPLRATIAVWFNLVFALDGRRLALEIFEGQGDIWVYEWARDTLTRLTFDLANDRKPVWSPAGRGIAFASARADKSTLNLYWQRADGTGDAQRLTEGKNNQYPASWHPSGTFLAFEEQSPATAYDLMILPLKGDDVSGWTPGSPTVFLNTPFAEREPMFSPDGQWLAYQSNESGRGDVDVYVRPFPGPGGKWQISAGGGTYPVWSRTKHELFYGTPNGQIMVAPYAVEGDSFRAGKPRLWSDGRHALFGNRMFDLHPDGDRFALAPAPQTLAGTRQDHVTFIFNFFDELRRIAPVAER